MPLLWRPHGHHRDFRAGLTPALPILAASHHQHRYLMSTITAFPQLTADLAWCRSLTARDAARQIMPLLPRRKLATAAFNPCLGNQAQLLLAVDHVTACVKALRARPCTPYTPAKSP